MTTLSWDLFARDKGASKTFDKVGKSMENASHSSKRASSKIAGSVKGIIGAGVALAAASGVATYIKSTTDAASDLNETVSKSKVIFGVQAAAMDKWASKSDKAFGMSKQAALDSAAGFGDMFSQLGFAKKASANMSKQVVQMSADLGSFNNLPTAEVTDMMAGAFRGEFDSLQRVIPNINAARVEQAALAATHKKSAKDLTASEKAAATLAIVQKDGARAAGDFARTSGGAANQQKILAAQSANLKAKLGSFLLPTLIAVQGFLAGKVMPAVDGFVSGMQDGTGAGGQFAAFLGDVGDKLKPVGAFLTGTVVPGIRALAAAFQAGGSDVTSSGFAGGMERIGLAAREVANFFQAQVVPAVNGIITAIRGFVAVALPIATAFVAGMMARIQPMMPTIRAIFIQIGAIVIGVMGLIQAIITRVTTVIAFIWARWGTQIMDFVALYWSKILVVIQAALGVIQGVIKTVTSLIKGDWAGVWAGIKQILTSAWALIKGIISAGATYIKGIMSGAWALIKLGASAAWGGIKALIAGAWAGIKSLVFAAAGSLRSAISGAWSAILAGAASKLGALVTFVRGIPGRFVAGLASLAGLLARMGSAAIGSLQSAIVARVGGVVSYVRGIPGRITSGLGDLGGLLTSAGTNIVQGLINGISGMGGQMVAFVKRFVTEHIPVPVQKALRMTSPSKVMIDIGRYVGQGLIVGLLGTGDQVSAAATTLANKIKDAATAYTSKKSSLATRINADRAAVGKAERAYRGALGMHGKKRVAAVRSAGAKLSKARGKLKTDRGASAALSKSFLGIGRSGSADDKALAKLKAGTKKAAGIASERASVADRLASAREHLADVMSQHSDMKSSVGGSVMSSFDITEHSESSGILSALATVVANARTFYAQLGELKKRGLAQGLLQQLAAAGPAALPAAQALSSMARDQFATVNSSYDQLRSIASQTGTLAADDMYGAGVSAAQGLVNGLAAKANDLAAAATKLAKSLVAAVKKALGIKSPSAVTFGLGEYTGQGFAGGLASMIPKVAGAAERLAVAAIPGTAIPGVGIGAARSSGAGERPIEVHVFIDGKDIHTSLVRRRTQLGRPLGLEA